MKSCEPVAWRRGERGVSLIETLVAVGLFSLTAATVGTFMQQQIRSGGSNYNSATAYSLAAEEFENLRSIPYDDIVSTSSALTEGTTTFTVTTAVQANDPAPNMKHITVDVAWNELNGDKHVTLETIYTEIRR